MQPDDHLRDVLRALSPREPGESLLDRVLRDGGDVVRDPDAPDLAALALVRAAASCTCEMHDDGDGESGPHLVVDGDVLCPAHGRKAAPEFWARGDDLDPITYLHDAYTNAMADREVERESGPAPRSSDPLVNEALGAYDASDTFKVSFTNRYGVL